MQILDFLTQQHKLFIVIATSHAYWNIYKRLKQAYLQVVEELGKENMDNLPEVKEINILITLFTDCNARNSLLVAFDNDCCQNLLTSVH